MSEKIMYEQILKTSRGAAIVLSSLAACYGLGELSDMEADRQATLSRSCLTQTISSNPTSTDLPRACEKLEVNPETVVEARTYATDKKDVQYADRDALVILGLVLGGLGWISAEIMIIEHRERKQEKEQEEIDALDDIYRL